MATGAGTQQDPYILTTWDDLIDSSRGTSTYSEWHGGNLDFNQVQPSGFTSQVTINGAIDFRGATLKNFRNIRMDSSDTGIWFHFGNGLGIKNLKFLNAYITNYRYGIAFGNADSYSGYTNNTLVSMLATTSQTMTLVCANKDVRHSGKFIFQSCTFNLECIAPNNEIYTFNSAPTLKDCIIETNIEQSWKKFTELYGDYFMGSFDDCQFFGNNESSSSYPIEIKGCNSCVFLFDDNTYKITSGVVSVYSSETCSVTNDSTNVEGCTSAQLNNAQYLHSIGFPIGVN